MEALIDDEGGSASEDGEDRLGDWLEVCLLLQHRQERETRETDEKRNKEREEAEREKESTGINAD